MGAADEVRTVRNMIPSRHLWPPCCVMSIILMAREQLDSGNMPFLKSVLKQVGRNTGPPGFGGCHGVIPHNFISKLGQDTYPASLDINSACMSWADLSTFASNMYSMLKLRVKCPENVGFQDEPAWPVRAGLSRAIRQWKFENASSHDASDITTGTEPPRYHIPTATTRRIPPK